MPTKWLNIFLASYVQDMPRQSRPEGIQCQWPVDVFFGKKLTSADQYKPADIPQVAAAKMTNHSLSKGVKEIIWLSGQIHTVPYLLFWSI